ncbi:hypothetical protein NUW54_g13354 [Trametes sanguinea]|uniref:Uncharacterized protein n=1 Tax=Trametes sanguinea TaxID=158606 RepID=A0ACC1MMB2_9APHY|nr:hypothetical protein NUW54_g13354 [Trametes sanguinea]
MNVVAILLGLTEGAIIIYTQLYSTRLRLVLRRSLFTSQNFSLEELTSALRVRELLSPRALASHHLARLASSPRLARSSSRRSREPTVTPRFHCGSAFVTFACLTILVPLFAELILVFRVVAVYPPHALSRAGWLAVYAPVAVFKLARIANDVVFVTRWARLNRHSVNPLQTGQTAWDLPNAKIEWFLQFFDTTYMGRAILCAEYEA